MLISYFVVKATKTGLIVKPDHCSQCGKPTKGHGLHGHHDDYEFPLTVRWLCSQCHIRYHREHRMRHIFYIPKERARELFILAGFVWKPRRKARVCQITKPPVMVIMLQRVAK